MKRGRPCIYAGNDRERRRQAHEAWKAANPEEAAAAAKRGSQKQQAKRLAARQLRQTTLR